MFVSQECCRWKSLLTFIVFAPCLFGGGSTHAQVTEDTHTHTHKTLLHQDSPSPTLPSPGPPPASSCLFLSLSFSLSFLLFPQCAVQSSVVEDVWPLTIHCGQGDTVHRVFCTAQCCLCCTAVTHGCFMGHNIKNIHKPSGFESLVAQVSHSLTFFFLNVSTCRQTHTYWCVQEKAEVVGAGEHAVTWNSPCKPRGGQLWF